MAIAIIGVFVVAGLSGLVIAKGPPAGIPNGPPEHANGPAEKATGCVLTDQRGWGIDFNAHEAKADRDAKGQIYHWSDEMEREIQIEVEYVNIEDEWGYFAGVCTYDSLDGTNIGQWLYVVVYDGGTPGTNGDQVWWDWNSSDEADAEQRVADGDTNSIEKGIIEGNLVVHTY